MISTDPLRSLQRFAGLLVCLVALDALTPASDAVDGVRVLSQFRPPNPQTALVQGPDGSFYGTTVGGGIYGFGEVFRIDPVGAFSVLHNFNGLDGNSPLGALLLGKDGNLYGATERGGAADLGVIYRVTTTGTLTLVHEFNGQDGSTPRGALMQASDGNFYGAASTGSGTVGQGTIFRMTPGGVLNTFHYFDGTDGTGPIAPPVEGLDGNFYVVTPGGPILDGSIIRLTPSGERTTLHTFSRDEGSAISWLTLLPDGSFQGATNRYLYRITPAGGYSLTTIHETSGRGFLPDFVSGFTKGPDGNYYGVTPQDVAIGGAIFRVTPQGALTIMTALPGEPDLSAPIGSLLLGADGIFYGTASGSTQGSGVFKYAPGGAVALVHSFDQLAGYHVDQPITQGSDGNFYGVTASSTDGSGGTAYQMTPAGARQTIFAFGATHGQPSGPLLQGLDGALYGTTFSGGADRTGEIFRLTNAGEISVLHTFAVGQNGTYPEGAEPIHGLVQTPNGDFYGVTQFGGANNRGAVFRMSPSLDVTVLYSFEDIFGDAPQALTIGSDGALYSTSGPDLYSDYRGYAYRLTTAGAFTLLHRFDAPGDRSRVGPLAQGADGLFYGATHLGSNGPGTIFSVSAGGDFKTVHQFAGAEGFDPEAGLVRAGDGKLYVLTRYGGSPFSSVNARGAIFQIDPSGALRTLHTFEDIADLGNASLIQGNDGNLYGTAPSWLTADIRGVVYRLNTHGVLSLAASPAKVSEGAGSVTFNVLRTGVGLDPVSVTCTTENGTAIAGVDYMPTKALVAWKAGDLEPKSVTILLINRHVSDGSTRNFTLSLSGPTGGPEVDSAKATATILADSPAPTATPTPTPSATPIPTATPTPTALPTPTPSPSVTPMPTATPAPTSTPTPTPTPTPAPLLTPVVTLTAANADPSLQEGAIAKALFTRSGSDTARSLTVYYEIKGTAKNGKDYATQAVSAVIPDGASSFKLKVQTLDDHKVEGKETVILKLLPSPDGSYTVGNPKKALFTIQDRE